LAGGTDPLGHKFNSSQGPTPELPLLSGCNGPIEVALQASPMVQIHGKKDEKHLNITLLVVKHCQHSIFLVYIEPSKLPSKTKFKY
jgi:hypothetical protein